MARVDHGLRGKRRNSFERCRKLRRVGERKIGSADRASEQTVANQCYSMAVGDPDRFELGTAAVDLIQQSLALTPRIDYHGAIRAIVDNQVAILLKRADSDGLDPHSGDQVYPPPLMCEASSASRTASPEP